MKYYITTLAVGEPYFSTSLEMYTALHEKTVDGYFNITTSDNDLAMLPQIVGISSDEFKLKYPKLQITTIEGLNKRITFPQHMEGHGFTFNLNLKVLSLKACLLSGNSFDYLIFVDGDWHLNDLFEEEKLKTLFTNLELLNVDFAFERPAEIGNYKSNNLIDCFFEEKLRDYNALEHDTYDRAHVVNEQFLAFRNNPKFRLFTQKWEQMMWYSIANNIRNYPDGFEIGISALESGMTWNFYMLTVVWQCFYFYAKYSSTKYVKF